MTYVTAEESEFQRRQQGPIDEGDLLLQTVPEKKKKTTDKVF